MSSEHDLWQVKLSEGCVVEMTIDEIDTAFNAGRIQASTAVLPPGDWRWTTLGEAAGLEDVAPYSIAPIAADVTPAPPVVDMDLGSPLATADQSIPGVPRRRPGRLRKVVGITALFGVLIAAGMAGGAYAARPVEFKAKVASVRDRLSGSHSHSQPARAAAVAAPPPPQAAPLAVPPSREIPPPPPAAEALVDVADVADVAAAAAPPPAAAAPTVGVDHLPDARAAKKKSAPPAKARAKRR